MNFNEYTTIEDWFCAQPQINGKDYVSQYNCIKAILDPIQDEIKSVVAKIDPTTYLNAHGRSHIKMVIEKITMLLNHNELNLSMYETYLLLLASQFHDIGHIYNGRDKHAKDAGRIISMINHQLLNAVDKKIIFDIASAHSGKDNPIGKLPVIDTISNEKIRYRLLSAILRLADELADGTERASNFLLELDEGKGQIPEESKIFHVFSHCLNSYYVDFESHEVLMKFFLYKEHVLEKFKKKTEDVFLIDEIYNRTLTTFTECLYYNRFVPESIRLNSVYVEIKFLTSEYPFLDFCDPIKFKIEEQGYPTLSSRNIFEICKNDLVKDGIKIDGQYVFNKL